jgi:hypothetical protein
MASDLFKPVLNDRTRSPNFFNGRLLTGEAMSEEQDAQRAVNELLGQALGDGVAYGLQVEVASSLSTITKPVLNVKSGVAVNRRGELLLLASDTQVQLVRPAEDVPSPATIFRACTPVTNGTYVADAGVYLLTICSVRAGNGMASVYGLGDAPSGCNVKDMIDAVEFRLLELPVDKATLGNENRLRNAVAYQCFGVDHGGDAARDPLGVLAAPATLLDDLRATTLTDCDIPLAILYWTATGGIRFVDVWSVRRRLTHTRTAAARFPLFGETQRATAEAMLLQFEEQIAAMSAAGQINAAVQGRSFFRYLPPAGLLPLASAGRPGIDPQQFFTGKTTRGPLHFGGSALRSLLETSRDFAPIDLDSGELVWLYFVVENLLAANAGVNPNRPRAVVAFATGHMPFLANARYDLSLWDYSNYALVPPQI